MRKLTGWRADQVRGHVDALTGGRVGGWAAAPGGVDVEVWLDGARVATVRPDIARPDVAAALPGLDGAGHSGFACALPPATDAATLQELIVVARPRRAWLRPRTLGQSRRPSPALLAQLAAPPSTGVTGPFPRPVIDAIASTWPEVCSDLVNPAGQLGFVERLAEIFATPELNALPVFADYARYLTMMISHCRFVERHFPVNNARAEPGANDFHCKPNSVKELFAIIHQLYVLQSWGVVGDFAEFGCFKGYSSAMLSVACGWLGIRMHIFDSFAGLPDAPGSSYRVGQFAGGLDEVRGNIARFGRLDAVEFHPGFFAESLRDYRPPALMSLWMDVDLTVSAEDLLVVADRVDPRASLFSHECPAQIFDHGRIIAEPGPDNPVTPLVNRFAQLGRPLTGHHIAGYTGAFWAREGGLAVADSATLDRMLRLFGPG